MRDEIVLHLSFKEYKDAKLFLNDYPLEEIEVAENIYKQGIVLRLEDSERLIFKKLIFLVEDVEK